MKIKIRAIQEKIFNTAERYSFIECRISTKREVKEKDRKKEGDLIRIRFVLCERMYCEGYTILFVSKHTIPLYEYAHEQMKTNTHTLTQRYQLFNKLILNIECTGMSSSNFSLKIFCSQICGKLNRIFTCA